MSETSVLLEAYLHHKDELQRFLSKRVGSHTLGSDLVQDLYIRLQKAQDVSPVQNRRAYLFSMAANLATDHLRVETRRAELRKETEAVAWRQAEDLTPERYAMGRAELDFVEDAVSKLTPRCRRVFFLCRYEGLSQAKAAVVLGISPSTVYEELKAAMQAVVAARRRFHGKANAGTFPKEDQT